jgi:hypothetical protein
MRPATAHVIRRATAEDEHALRLLAALADRPPLDGAILVGELDGSPAAAISLSDGRIIVDPRHQGTVLAHVLHVRAAGLHAHARGPWLPARFPRFACRVPG